MPALRPPRAIIRYLYRRRSCSQDPGPALAPDCDAAAAKTLFTAHARGCIKNPSGRPARKTSSRNFL